jgi:predicted DNA-binding ribbon-helix-helix protein
MRYGRTKSGSIVSWRATSDAHQQIVHAVEISGRKRSQQLGMTFYLVVEKAEERRKHEFVRQCGALVPR